MSLMCNFSSLLLCVTELRSLFKFKFNSIYTRNIFSTIKGDSTNGFFRWVKIESNNNISIHI